MHDQSRKVGRYTVSILKVPMVRKPKRVMWQVTVRIMDTYVEVNANFPAHVTMWSHTNDTGRSRVMFLYNERDAVDCFRQEIADLTAKILLGEE